MKQTMSLALVFVAVPALGACWLHSLPCAVTVEQLTRLKIKEADVASQYLVLSNHCRMQGPAHRRRVESHPLVTPA